MKTITKTFNIYKFDELNEEQQNKVLENLWDLDVSFDWWESSYEDANNMKLNITSFDIERNNYCNIEFVEGAEEATDAIIHNCGEDTNLFKLAKNFNGERDNLVYKHSDKINTELVHEDNIEKYDEDLDLLIEQLTKDLETEYLQILNQDYEYRLSRECIIESIESMDYSFTEDCEIY